MAVYCIRRHYFNLLIYTTQYKDIMIRLFTMTVIFSIAILFAAPINAQSRLHGAYYGASQVAQNDAIRSRSEVVQEVKERYNAKVLRIQLSRDQSVYKVRVLMPNGKVRDLSIRARR